ncbi:MAG: RtcB family protein [Bacilli bacterium]|nr:RtcB family protein [Bacilli bacterium]
MKPTKIYAEMIDSIALEQFENAMSLTCNVQGALMPDAHAGYTLPIGAVIKSKQMVFPSYVGYDIGCGMCAVKLDIAKEDIEYERLKKEIIKAIPLGMSRHQTKQPYVPLTCTPKAQEMFDEIGAYQLGTLGGGNHFIELGSGNDGKVWIVIHSGSRGFGKNIAEYYMKLAAMSHVPTDEWREAFEKSHVDFKKHNPEKYEMALSAYLEKQKASMAKTHLEKHVGFSITSTEGKEYLLDMECALAFALENRKRMIDSIVSLLGNPQELLFINRNHNHAEIKEEFVIHRKGATHAEEGMLGVIPGNMRDGSFIVKGKGNEASLCSSSHGAGRVLSRNQAFLALNVDQFHNDMQGICTNHTDKMLDESPRAYKDIFEVMALQEELVDVIDHVKPFLNIKG